MKLLKLKIFIFIILIVVVVFQITSLNIRSAVGDEFGTIWLASQKSVSFIINKVHKDDVHPPTQYLISHYWGKIFGYGDFSMRILPLVLVLLSLCVVWKIVGKFNPEIDYNDKLLIFLLVATTPFIWTTANVCRYYSLGVFFGLISFYFYIKWYEKPSNILLLIFTIFITSLLFYIHYLIAVVITIGQGLHFITNVRNKNAKQIGFWILSQIMIIILILPAVFYSVFPIINGDVNNLANSSYEGINGSKGILLVLMGNLFTTFTGGIPFPWDLWITIPLAIILVYLISYSIKKWGNIFNSVNVNLIIIPFILLSVAIALLTPVIGFFNGIYRAGSLAILVLVMTFSQIIKIPVRHIKYFIVTVILLINLFLIYVYNLNCYSFNQTPPLKEIVGTIRKISHEGEGIVVHPFGHGWGDPMKRYLPDRFTTSLLTDREVSNDINDIVKKTLPREIFLINSNRFDSKSSEFDIWLLSNGYSLIYKKEFQEQSDYSLWFKNAIRQYRFLNYRQEKSQKYILLLRGYELTSK